MSVRVCAGRSQRAVEVLAVTDEGLGRTVWCLCLSRLVEAAVLQHAVRGQVRGGHTCLHHLHPSSSRDVECGEHALSREASPLDVLGDPETKLSQLGSVDVADVHSTQDLTVPVNNDEEQGGALSILVYASGEPVI